MGKLRQWSAARRFAAINNENVLAQLVFKNATYMFKDASRCLNMS